MLMWFVNCQHCETSNLSAFYLVENIFSRQFTSKIKTSSATKATQRNPDLGKEDIFLKKVLKTVIKESFRLLASLSFCFSSFITQ